MWFLAKIKYNVQDSNNKWKAHSEQFLLENVTYGGAETDLAKILEGRVTDYEYDISKVKFGSVYEPFNTGDFYKVTIEEKTYNELDKEKISILTHYVIAESVHEAEERANEYMKTWVTDTTIVGAIKCKILGVWHPHNSMWQDDFKQRMLILAEEGNESADANQLNIPFNKEDQLDDLPDSETDAQKIANSLGGTVAPSNRKKKKTAEPVEAD